jgi:signal peptidase
MTLRRRLGQLFELLAILFVVSLVAGQALGQPVLLSYVTSGSMSPTLEPDDGFVAIPQQLAGPVEEGDVIVFRAQELDGGGLTTHRVVEETERGYITRGDANPFTDQAGDEPPVKRAQVVAVALEVNGGVVVVPSVGVAVEGMDAAVSAAQRFLATTLGSRAFLGPQGFAYLVVAFSGLAYVLDLLFGGEGGRRDYDRGDRRSRDSGRAARTYVLAFALLLVLAATGSMVAPSGPTEFGIVSAEFDSDRPDVIPAGESDAQQITIPNDGLIPTTVFVEAGSDGIAVEDRVLTVPPRGEATTTMTLSAPPETGYYRRYLIVHRYLGVLPLPVLQSLYGLHPWAPIVAIDVLLGGTFYLIGSQLVTGGRIRRRERERDLPWEVKLRRTIRRRL